MSATSSSLLGANVIALIGDLDEALDLLAHGGFDDIVVDVSLRRHRGIRIADQLQQRGIPFVFSTGYGAETIPDRLADVIRWEIVRSSNGGQRSHSTLASGLHGVTWAGRDGPGAGVSNGNAKAILHAE